MKVWKGKGVVWPASDQGPRPPSEEGQQITLTHFANKYYKGAVFPYLNCLRRGVMGRTKYGMCWGAVNPSLATPLSGRSTAETSGILACALGTEVRRASLASEDPLPGSGVPAVSGDR